LLQKNTSLVISLFCFWQTQFIFSWDGDRDGMNSRIYKKRKYEPKRKGKMCVCW